MSVCVLGMGEVCAYVQVFSVSKAWGSPGTGVTDVCELPDVAAGNGTWVLHRNNMCS